MFSIRKFSMGGATNMTERLLKYSASDDSTNSANKAADNALGAMYQTLC